MDIFLNEPEFSYQPARQPSQQGTSLNEQQSTTTANDAYLIDQLKQQLMGDSSQTSLSDLFAANDDSKFLTEAPVTRTSRGDPFFSPDICNERVAPQMEPQRCTSSRSFQQPSSAQVIQLNALLTENRATALAENRCGFAQNAGQSMFLGSTTHNSVYQVLPCGSQVTVMQSKVAPSASQGSPWLQQSPSPSASSSSVRYSPSSEPTRGTSQQQQQQQQPINANYALSIMCLQNEVHPNNCRRGSTGSLQPGKGKKHVTFLCPQVGTVPSFSL